MRRKTKIVATIGPASHSFAAIEKLVAAGLNVARLNFSHGDHASHLSVMEWVRQVSRRAGRPVALLQDLSGPKIRIGQFEQGEVRLKSGDRFILSGREFVGDRKSVSLSYKDLARDVSPGTRLLLSDGQMELEVESVKDKDILCRVIVGGLLGSHKGLNLPDKTLSVPTLTEKDRDDLIFGLEQGVDLVALSFVRTAAEVREVRELIMKSGKDPWIIAKIEKHEAVTNIDEILEAADGIMVARGDLGVEIPIEDIPRVQKMIISKANEAAKPVITATQMLKSMVDNPRPTRAEVTDVANAILDGSDAVMLSEETAVGKYAAETVAMMERIALRTEAYFPHQLWLTRSAHGPLSTEAAVAYSACEISACIGAGAIATTTQTGSTTRLVARYRPRQSILAVTPDHDTYQRLALVWGAAPVLTGETDHTEKLEKETLRLARESGWIKMSDSLVFTAGVPLHVPGTTNIIKVIK